MERIIQIMMVLTVFQDSSRATDCNTKFSNGHLSTNCSGHANEICSFQCGIGFLRKTDVSSIRCQPSGSWSPAIDDFCTKVTCTGNIPFGHLQLDCTGLEGDICKFVCDDGYTPSSTQVRCLSTGTWDTRASKLCNDEGFPYGLPVGLCAGGVVVLVAIVVGKKYNVINILCACRNNDDDEGTPGVPYDNSEYDAE